ncbi:hypothetical protein ACTQXV_01080 [Ligilactobacillus salivarius]|uniref:hypothetical protein n=1 Tax=Ligilactobacillus salivarius TaxID=1624 RepID=UPI003F8CB64D
MANDFAKLAINAYNLIDISKKQGFKKEQKIALDTRELSGNTPKNVIKLFNKFPY